jgi:hypothetical protein
MGIALAVVSCMLLVSAIAPAGTALAESTSPATGWKMVTGEQSLVTDHVGGIDRDNVYSVFKVNVTTGEVVWLRCSYGGTAGVQQTLVPLSQPQTSGGPWDLIVAENSLISDVSVGDIDTENLFCAFLLEQSSGRAWRLYTTHESRKVHATWQELPAPPQVPGAHWELFAAEHSVTQTSGLDLRRQNIYSVFLLDTNGGTVLRLHSRYDSRSGKVRDAWVK